MLVIKMKLTHKLPHPRNNNTVRWCNEHIKSIHPSRHNSNRYPILIHISFTKYPICGGRHSSTFLFNAIERPVDGMPSNPEYHWAKLLFRSYNLLWPLLKHYVMWTKVERKWIGEFQCPPTNGDTSGTFNELLRRGKYRFLSLDSQHLCVSRIKESE